MGWVVDVSHAFRATHSLQNLFTHGIHAHVYVYICVCVRERVYVYVCMCMYVYIYTQLYVCICICICTCTIYLCLYIISCGAFSNHAPVGRPIRSLRLLRTLHPRFFQSLVFLDTALTVKGPAETHKHFRSLEPRCDSGGQHRRATFHESVRLGKPRPLVDESRRLDMSVAT